jgi:hypothetical protein
MREKVPVYMPLEASVRKIQDASGRRTIIMTKFALCSVPRLSFVLLILRTTRLRFGYGIRHLRQHTIMLSFRPSVRPILHDAWCIIPDTDMLSVAQSESARLDTHIWIVTNTTRIKTRDTAWYYRKAWRAILGSSAVVGWLGKLLLFESRWSGSSMPWACADGRVSQRLTSLYLCTDMVGVSHWAQFFFFSKHKSLGTKPPKCGSLRPELTRILMLSDRILANIDGPMIGLKRRRKCCQIWFSSSPGSVTPSTSA